MSEEKIEALRVETVRLLDAAEWGSSGAELGHMLDVCDAIETIRAFLSECSGEFDDASDVAALHALALLLAAMTEAT